MGGSAEFRCVVNSNGAPVMTPVQITWLKDGRQLPTTGRNGDTLLLSSIGKEDKAMYQCVVRTLGGRPEGDTFQASAELQLGGEFADYEKIMTVVTFNFFIISITAINNDEKFFCARGKTARFKLFYNKKVN